MTAKKHIDIVFDGAPSMPSPRFIEVENEKGESIKYDKWVQRKDGYWVLRIPDTLHIAEQAVGGEIQLMKDLNEAPVTVHIYKEKLEGVLSRIKTLIEE